MGHITSPLRYPGGKTRLASFIKQIIIDNDLLGGDYVEVYAGGAGIAWSLLFDGYVAKVHINDLNKSIWAFWHSVLNDTDNLCRLIRDTPVTIETWNAQKHIQRNPSGKSNLELGFSTFFLNRTNRSGIILGGAIGGKKQDGAYKLDARYKKDDLIKRIEEIAKYKKKILLYRKNALDFIQSHIPKLPLKSLIYLDPPYYCKGAYLYENHYNHTDHVAIANAVRGIKQKWVMSYDNTPEIQTMYSLYKKIIYELSYSAANRYKGSEVVFTSPTISDITNKSPLLYKKPSMKTWALQQSGQAK